MGPRPDDKNAIFGERFSACFVALPETRARKLDMAQQKVFGIGLSRTGTTSLTEALRILGYRAVHCPLSIVTFNGKRLGLNTRVVDQYDAFTDSPVAGVYRELDKSYPGSKFILTTRPIDKWIASVRRMRLSFVLLEALPKVRCLAKEICGTASFFDEPALLRAYENHGKSVRDYFGNRAGTDLLVLDVSSGDAWDRLSSFLGHHKPSGSFPHYNRGYATTFTNMRDLIRHSWPLI
jgi:Sulfotransferase domain